MAMRRAFPFPLWLLPVLLLMVLIPAAGAHANIYETWIEYAPGTVNPGPWTFVTTTSYITGQVETIQTSPVSANVYAFAVATPAGFTGGNANLSATVNATANQITIYFQGKVISGTAPANATMKVLSGNTVLNTFSLATTWTNYSVVMYAVPNSAYTITFELSMPSQSTAQSFTYAISIIEVVGGIAITPNANLYLLNYPKQTWFDIASYPGSAIYVTYSSSSTPQQIAYDPQAPDLSLNLQGATLVTVYVGNYYMRTLIPTPSGTTCVWLTPPGSTLSYVISVEDLSGDFHPGTVVQISAGPYVIASGYMDTQYTFPVDIQPGMYTLTLSYNGYTYSAPISFGSSPTITVVVPAPNTATKATHMGSLSASAAWNSTGTGVVVSYYDATGSTSSVTFTVYLQNSTGTAYQMAQQSFTSGPYSSVTTTIPATNFYMNQSPELYVAVQYNSTVFGVGTMTEPLSGGTVFPSVPTIPTTILGLSWLLPGASAGLYLLAYVMLVTMAAAFGARAAPVGLVLVALFALLFAAAGWLPISTSAMIGVLAIVFILLLRRMQQRGWYG